ncbi:DUF4153 domain-containing protein [Nostocoides australiense]
MASPLARAASLKIKLGALVAVSVLFATVIATVGANSKVTPWLVVPVTIAVALAVTQWLAAGMTAPLRAMTQAAGRMAQGDYTSAIPVGGNDEVADLARAFRAMATDLQDADQQRRQLIATVSHELRTPAAALRALLENMADGVTPADPANLESALGQADRLSDLLTDLLTLSRLDAGITDLRLESVAVQELLDQVVAEYAAGGRPVTTQIDVRPPTLTVRAEPARLRQAVTNLLDNAARHTPSGTTVTLTAATAAPDRWHLDIADEGPGIAEADRDRIFERFGTDSAGGTGLGLAITRWVAEIHGGTVAAIDPQPGRRGARLRLTLPTDPMTRIRPDSVAGVRMPPAPPTPPRAPSSRPPGAPIPLDLARPERAVASRPRPAEGPVIDGLFGRVWPETVREGRPRLVALAALVGAMAGLLLPERDTGIAWSVVLLATGAAVVMAARRRTWMTAITAVLGVGLAALATLRAAEVVVPLSILAAALLIVVTIVPVSSAYGLMGAAAAWPTAGIRGLPWLGRSLARSGTAATWWRVARTATISLLALAIFGSLFASADAIFGHWVDVLIPDLTVDTFVARLFVGIFFGGFALAGMYLAINPIRDEALTLPKGRPLAHPWEWLVPVGLIVATYLLFIIAQASAWLGGHDFVQRATGLTYADYVHQGFGQLTVATVLTLVVVALTVRKVAQADPGDRLLLRVVLGLLCILTLAVVASALWRMHLYQQAFGYTTLRLLVDFFEAWVAIVVVMVMVAGITFRGRWIPTAAVVAGAALVLCFGLLNPDAWVAERNLQRYAATGKLDGSYLTSLSADAAPAVAASTLSPADKRCILGNGPGQFLTEDDALEWNLGRVRARAALAQVGPGQASRSCAPIGS